MARILVGAYVVRFPVGGYLSWTLQWLLGFRRLGHEVILVEKSGYPGACFDPVSRTYGDDCSYGTGAVRDMLAPLGLGESWCFVDGHGQYHGLSETAVRAAFSGADLFVDMGSHGAWMEEAAGCRLRVFVDGEPGFRQFHWQRALDAGGAIPAYDHYFSVGANIGTAASRAPAAGIAWHHVFDPVVTDFYPVLPAPANAPFTTVMSWQAHEPIEYGGSIYGQKDVEFARFLDLPGRTRVPLEVAVSGNAPLSGLAAAGWLVRDSIEVTLTLEAWKRYIAASRGEFSVCKNVFVATNSGFFSDRSAAYLASGRPVVMQDTGFSAHLPSGRGLFAVRNAEEAASAIDEIASDYPRHSRWAREVASAHLEADRVLAGFLNEIRV